MSRHSRGGLTARQEVPKFLREIIATNPRATHGLPDHMKGFNRGSDNVPLERDAASKRKRADLVKSDDDVVPIVANLAEFDADEQRQVQELIDAQYKVDATSKGKAADQTEDQVEEATVSSDVVNRAKRKNDNDEISNPQPTKLMFQSNRSSDITKAKANTASISKVTRKPAPSLTFDDEED